MAAPLAELSGNLPCLRTGQRTPSLKSGAPPSTPGITPGGRHFRAPEHENAALARLSEEATGFIDALAAAAPSRSRTAALVSTLDLRLVGMRMALRAVPTVDEAQHEEWPENGVLRQQLWAALEFLQQAVDASRSARDGDAPPSPEAAEAQRARGEAVATPLRRARFAGATPERTPGSARRGEGAPTPFGDFCSRTPLPGAPGGLYAGGDAGETDAADVAAHIAAPAATPLPRMASLALTPVAESEADAEEAAAASTPQPRLALTPLPAAEMAAASETPLAAPTRFALSSPAAAAFARSVTLSLSLPRSPAAPAEEAEATPDSVLLAGRLFAASSLERGASLPAPADVAVPAETQPAAADDDAASVAAQAPPQAPVPRQQRTGLHPALWLLREALLLGAAAAAGAAFALRHERNARAAEQAKRAVPEPAAEPQEATIAA